MAAFEYRQAEEIRETFARHRVRYLFIGKSAAILLGFPDTTQDADLFVEKSQGNCRAIVAALRELGFTLNEQQAAEIVRQARESSTKATESARAERDRALETVRISLLADVDALAGAAILRILGRRS